MKASAVTSGAGFALVTWQQLMLMPARVVSISVMGHVLTVLSRQLPRPCRQQEEEEEEVAVSSAGQDPCCSLHLLPTQ